LAALATDGAVASRFQCVALQRWKMGVPYLRHLRTIEVLPPLKQPSGLAHETKAAAILSMSRGATGQVDRLINAAAVEAG
jgi:hypothetical protein